MSDPFVAEIRIFGFNFAPRGWAFCNGQILPISQNTALFSLLGTNYGGNGATTFGLPNLMGSAPMAHGHGPGLSDRFIGESGGTETVTLLESEIPNHTHAAQGKGTPPPSTGGTPAATAALGRSNGGLAYTAVANLTPMSPSVISPAGAGFPHNNMMPYLTVNFCIALQGIFPPRS
jgi:microcystin-dependent protein